MNVIAPLPSVKLEFHVEPHPDPVVRALIEEVERLRRENGEVAWLRAENERLHARLKGK
jgi:hypothetical protein